MLFFQRFEEIDNKSYETMRLIWKIPLYSYGGGG